MSSQELLESVELSDGRSLSFARFGDPSGKPVFYFHGFPGSRLEPHSNHEKFLEAGIQLLALDRPGIGYSTRKSKRRLLDWPDDVADATVLALSDFKNPYDSNASAPLTKGGQYWYDKDVGYVRVHTESVTQLEVLICVKTPCGSKPNPNVYHTLVRIDD